MTTLAELVLALSIALVVYHHAGYPVLLKLLAARALRKSSPPSMPPANDALATITLIVPAHNEAAVMVAKLANLAALDYPRDRLRIVLALDGSTDDSRAIVQASLPRLRARHDFELVEYPDNVGKVAVLNAQIARAQGEVVVLSDASAAVEPTALRQLAAHFARSRTGVVCGAYRLEQPGSDGERLYWAYQVAVKANEAAVAAPMGAHGAFYAFRRDLWRPLPADTINDDFVLPMRIVAEGWDAVYDPAISVLELERTARDQEFRRRVRIGAGNFQQVLRLARLADPRRPALAFVFLSGKGLRPAVPFLTALAAASTLGLALTVPGMLFKVLAALGTLAMVSIACVTAFGSRFALLHSLAYVVEGHTASALGALAYLTGRRIAGWQPVASGVRSLHAGHVGSAVGFAKRAVDIVLSVGVLGVLALLFVPIALAIKLESRGPVFYRQRRVGRISEEMAETFMLIKFRTMRSDAELHSGAVWAAKNDARVTRVGRFLRKTRLDELPQCLNVLRGDMSIVGPRPERPAFFARLEEEVPFYTERTFGVRPGITGLAQVNLPYDASIEDVRMKCVYDHVYAARIANFSEWLRTDFGIMARTLKVMVTAQGH